jgi:DNA-binding CsgD family transcriptional regulator
VERLTGERPILDGYGAQVPSISAAARWHGAGYTALVSFARADNFAEVAHALLGAAITELGARGGAVEAHDSTGLPVTCVATDDLGPDWPDLYLTIGHRLDPCLPRIRAARGPFATADVMSPDEARELAARLGAPADLYLHGVVCALVGDAAPIGAARIAWPRAPSPRLLVEVAGLCAHASVRLARIGFPTAAPPGMSRLTARQLEVAGLVARGYTNPEIASALAITCDAVKKHVGHVLAALDVSNRTELAALFARVGVMLRP